MAAIEIASHDYAIFFPLERRSPLPGGYMGKILQRVGPVGLNVRGRPHRVQ
ncbi:MAG: hypothetical protein HY694_07710 [Deltaproteobacteria bacterium]|nr:hypothetical protein [Deltaproteobacteria bacterium]